MERSPACRKKHRSAFQPTAKSRGAQPVDQLRTVRGGIEENMRMREQDEWTRGDGASRFFISQCDIDEGKGEIYLSSDDARHIKDVLRMSAGGKITVCDGDNLDYRCVIKSIENGRVTASIVSKAASVGEPAVIVRLYQGAPKGDKFDLVVQKCVEAGVYSIDAMLTTRSLIKPVQSEKRIYNNKLRRWRRISYEAAKQAGRGIVPEVNAFVTFEVAIKEARAASDLVLIPYEELREPTLKSVFRRDGGACTPDFKDISVLIGPEGGFEPSEVEMAEKAGAVAVSLGPRILRTETAGVVVLSSIMYELE
ncbi:MAG: 16S rRNA (uracil(1498)-N(3))-methyltransferase [Oscillospiraceae bacterium]|nr:16S rRNA (uracil(1498)-N(3))-methyltransferase [Oscillospiraceae bacterium]